MKKFNLILLVLMSVIILASCGEKKGDAVEDNEKQTEEATQQRDESIFYIVISGKEYTDICDRIYKVDELADVSKDSLRILRNAIFAKYGYQFKSKDLENYFSKYKWYSPTSKNVTSKFSEIEKKNIDLLNQLENGTDPKFLAFWEEFKQAVIVKPDYKYIGNGLYINFPVICGGEGEPYEQDADDIMGGDFVDFYFQGKKIKARLTNVSISDFKQSKVEKGDYVDENGKQLGGFLKNGQVMYDLQIDIKSGEFGVKTYLYGFADSGEGYRLVFVDNYESS